MRLSVVVPSSHEAPTLDRCLAAIRSSMSSGDELIVVDTASGGAPARRRNDGALRATGDVLVFVNADVIPHPTALDRVPTAFVDEPRLDAVFGCYDEARLARGESRPSATFFITTFTWRATDARAPFGAGWVPSGGRPSCQSADSMLTS
jgi:glycosyltransferase involved in cell wall biosynthesis